ncbi:MAG: glycosyltransferase family 2 protein [Magnetococcales bacterium]|nr:glycosyltransferase family 2 protein [Magnetococcales bacterium]
MKSLPMTSILVPVFNNLPILEYMIRSIIRHTGSLPYEIIVVDNHSTEEGCETIFQRLAALDQVTLIRNPSNLGFGKANNQALAISQGEVIVLLNSDMFVNQRWLLPFLRRLLHHPDCGAVQGKVILPKERHSPDGWTTQTVGSCFNQQGFPEYQLANVPHQDRSVNQPMRLQAFMGTGVAIKRSVIEQVGFFDESYDLVFLEDTDLSLRISQAGYEIWYEPMTEFYHLHSASMPHLSQEEYDRSRQSNSETFQQKWPLPLIQEILQRQGW